MTQPLLYRGTEHKPNTPTLRMQEVSVAYLSQKSGGSVPNGKVYAIESITFTAQAGEQICVIGPNGAGKSTLLKVAAGILEPDSGRVELFGFTPDKHICIGYVPQRSEIDWTFPVTVFDVVMMGRTKQIGLFRWAGRKDRAIVQESLARVQAEDLAQKQIGELSGGQQQRVFIARALAQEANLILMDEPLGGLDIPSQESILNILDTLREDGVTVMLATHDLGLAAERFDRIMLINRSIISMGHASIVLTPENLIRGYGGEIQLQNYNRAQEV